MDDKKRKDDTVSYTHLAYKVEKMLSKTQILELYLNEIFVVLQQIFHLNIILI